MFYWYYPTHRFTATYGSRVHTALPFAMNSEFSRVLAAQIVSQVNNKCPQWEFDHYF